MYLGSAFQLYLCMKRLCIWFGLYWIPMYYLLSSVIIFTVQLQLCSYTLYSKFRPNYAPLAYFGLYFISYYFLSSINNIINWRSLRPQAVPGQLYSKFGPNASKASDPHPRTTPCLVQGQPTAHAAWASKRTRKSD